MIEVLQGGAAFVDVVVFNSRKQAIGVWPGLIDTGAVQTAIPWKCRKRLGIAPRAMIKRSAFDPRLPSRRYLVYPVLLRTPPLAPTELMVLVVPMLRRVLLGQDFLQRYAFAYDGPNGWFGLESAAVIGESLKQLFA